MKSQKWQTKYPKAKCENLESKKIRKTQKMKKKMKYKTKTTRVNLMNINPYLNLIILGKRNKKRNLLKKRMNKSSNNLQTKIVYRI